jgi:hypothetical protein
MMTYIVYDIIARVLGRLGFVLYIYVDLSISYFATVNDVFSDAC